MVTIDAERVQLWLRRGARPSDSARQLLVKEGILAARPFKITPRAEVAAEPAEAGSESRGCMLQRKHLRPKQRLKHPQLKSAEAPVAEEPAVEDTAAEEAAVVEAAAAEPAVEGADAEEPAAVAEESAE